MVAELGAGRVLSIRAGAVEVLASGLRDPLGVAIGPDGACFVSEAGAGRVVELTAAGVQTVLDGLQRPQGILVREGQLYVVDAGAKALIAFDLERRARRTIATRSADRRSARRRSQAAAWASAVLRAAGPVRRASPRARTARSTSRPTREGSVLALRNDAQHPSV